MTTDFGENVHLGACMWAVHSSQRSRKLSLSLIMFSTIAYLVFIDEYLSDKWNI